MAKWIHPDVYSKGIEQINAYCTKVVAILNYSNVYATVVASNNVVADAIVASADFTISAPTSNTLKIAMATKSGEAVNLNGDPTHVAWVDVANSKVLVVLPETQSVTFSPGGTVTFNGSDILTFGPIA